MGAQSLIFAEWTSVIWLYRRPPYFALGHVCSDVEKATFPGTNKPGYWPLLIQQLATGLKVSLINKATPLALIFFNFKYFYFKNYQNI
jgi:hypothetical protein